jgi:hypothetical protein
MGCTPAAKPVAAHHAGETPTNGGTAHVDCLADFKKVNRDAGAGLVLRGDARIDPELPQAPARLGTGPGVVPLLGPGHATRAPRPGGHLQSSITIALIGFHLGYPVGLYLDHCNWGRTAILIEDPSHANFFPDQS